MAFVESLPKPIDIFLPHTDRPNLFYALALASKNVKGVGFIEDGWKTWRHLRYGVPGAGIHPPQNDGSKLAQQIYLYALRLTWWLGRLEAGKRLALLLTSILLRTVGPRIRWGSFHMSEKSLGFVTSFAHAEAKFVNICPWATSDIPKKVLADEVLLFLNPRYILESEELAEKINQMIWGRKLSLALHPGFWRHGAREKLQFFVEQLWAENNVAIFEQSEDDWDIVFDAYQQGFREYWAADSTVQVTAHEYRQYLPGLKLFSLSEVVDGRAGFIEHQLGYRNQCISY